MGANLIGYLVKGPRTLDVSKQDKAVDRVLRVLEVCKKYNDWAENPDNIGEEYDFSELDGLVDLADAEEVFDLADIVIGFPATKESAEKIVNDLIYNWPPRARDVVCKIDPDDENQVIVFCGDMSWGDEPEGIGYQMLKDGFMFGVWSLFGVR